MRIPLTQLCVFGPLRGARVCENVFLFLLKPSFFFPPPEDHRLRLLIIFILLTLVLTDHNFYEVASVTEA